MENKMAKQTVEEIAKAKQAEIDKANKDKAVKEAAAKAGTSPEEYLKAKEAEKVKKREDAEAQAQKDAELMTTADDKLDEKGKKRKQELVKAKEEREKSRTPQEKMEIRINELHGQIKDLKRDKDADQGKIQELEGKLTTLEAEREEERNKPKEEAIKAEKDELKKAEHARIQKYLEEDKEKPRTERREMTTEELDSFLSDDYAGAQEWLIERSQRRVSERKNDKINKDADKTAKAIIEHHDKLMPSIYKKHPELNIVARQKELAEQGKSQTEIGEILIKENEKLRITKEIIAENPNKYLLSKNGPTLVVEEMEKRLGKKAAPKKDKESDEDREARIREEAAEAERQRLANIDEENIDSSREGVDTFVKVKSELAERESKILEKVGMSKKRLAELKARRSHIKGANGTS